MKFWKPTLVTSFLFFAVTGVVFYTSCEKNPCNDVYCTNGGSCNNGICNCPTGFEDPSCGTKTTTRYVGTYAGYTGCNIGAQVIDTVFISDNVLHNNLAVKVIQKTHVSEVLTGSVTNNASTYSISIPDKTALYYSKVYHVTLQSNNKLVMETYESDSTTPGNMIKNTCTFVGTKVSN